VTPTHSAHVVPLTVFEKRPAQVAFWTPIVVATVGLACEEAIAPVDVKLTYVPDDAQLPETARVVPKALQDELENVAIERELHEKLRHEMRRGGAYAAEAYLEKEEARMSSRPTLPTDSSLHAVRKNLYAVKRMSKPKPSQLGEKRYRDPPPSPADSDYPVYRSAGISPSGPFYSPYSINDTDLFMAALTTQSPHSPVYVPHSPYVPPTEAPAKETTEAKEVPETPAATEA
jgi:hypothetical protein